MIPPAPVDGPSHPALRPIALVEAGKGALVLTAGFGLLGFLGRDAEAVAENLILRAHLNPAHHYPHVFIQAMATVDNSRLWLLAGLAALYAAVRFAEAYGLWLHRRWAEWLAALSGGIYVPLELYQLWHRPSWWKLAVLGLNAAIVAYMAWLLADTRRRAGEAIPMGRR